MDVGRGKVGVTSKTFQSVNPPFVGKLTPLPLIIGVGKKIHHPLFGGDSLSSCSSFLNWSLKQVNFRLCWCQWDLHLGLDALRPPVLVGRSLRLLFSTEVFHRRKKKKWERGDWTNIDPLLYQNQTFDSGPSPRSETLFVLVDGLGGRSERFRSDGSFRPSHCRSK